MKMRIMRGLFVFVLLGIAPPFTRVNAQVPIVTTLSKKVIMAIDLEVQRMQNETIWYQNVQKELENILSETKLTEISDWVQKQKDLYSNYFDELWQVKAVIEYYHRIKEITEKQIRLVNEYESAYSMFQQDKHFTEEEIEYMEKVYSGIVDASLKNLDQLLLVINSFNTQMTDEKRLSIIDQVAQKMDENYNDFEVFNNQNMMLSLQRSKDLNEINVVKQLYGLE